jgi:DNA-binding winged helix-turn-helix (wHTH) protein
MHYVEPLIGIVNWRYDRATGRLSLIDDSTVVHKLEPRLHHLLNYFLQHPNQIISKDQLMDDVWPEGEGTDAAVMRAVASLRKILQPGLADQACIETLSKRGYRWLLPLTELPLQKIEKVALQFTAEEHSVTFPQPAEQKNCKAIALPAQPVEQQSASQAIQHKSGFSRYWLAGLSTLLLLGLLLSIWLSPDTEKPTDIYSQQLTISALAGNEVSPLLTADQQHLFYHYQLPPQQKWRWLKHDLTNNKQQSASQTFDKLGQAVWLDPEHFVFQAQVQQQCHFYLQVAAELTTAARQVFPCQQLVRHGLVKWQDNLFWLTQAEDQSIQLWQRPASEFNQTSGSEAKLSYQFAPGYRRALQLVAHQQHLYLLLEKDFAQTSLFRLDPADAELIWLQDFNLHITHLAGWQRHALLLATAQGPMLYDLRQSELTRLNTAQGLYTELYPQPQNILAISLLDGTADILPVKTAAAAVPSSLSQWLNSNKNEYQLATMPASIAAQLPARLAFVSERSGMPQIWLQQQDKLQQLTSLTRPVRISQLLWHQQKLYALLDAVLSEISLTDGSVTALDVGQPSRLVSCQQQLYWTAWSADGWNLFRLDKAQQAEKIRPNVVDARCGPDGQLVLLPFGAAALELWQPDSDQKTTLAVQLNWRQQAADSWLTTETGLYWLQRQQLWFLGWDKQQPEPVQTEPSFAADEIYRGIAAEQIYFQKVNELQADVIWLNPPA